MPKTIRFADLVKKSGRPTIAILWTEPAQDPDFQKALKQNRILTVSQKPTGTKKDVATIGFKQERNVAYLIFPKELPADQEAKVVGVKYDLVQQPEVTDPVKTRAIRPASTSKVTKRIATTEEAPPQKKKLFRVVFKRTAVWESTLEIMAKNKTEAKAAAETQIAGCNLSLSDAILQNEVRDVHEMAANSK